VYNYIHIYDTLLFCIPIACSVKECSPSEVIPMHPDFRMIVLANRPGFPFLGNDFFAALGESAKIKGITFCRYCRYHYINLQVLASTSTDTDTTDVHNYWSIKLTAKVNFNNISCFSNKNSTTLHFWGELERSPH